MGQFANLTSMEWHICFFIDRSVMGPMWAKAFSKLKKILSLKLISNN